MAAGGSYTPVETLEVGCYILDICLLRESTTKGIIIIPNTKRSIIRMDT